MDPREIVIALRNLMIRANVNPGIVNRINFQQLIIDNWERIQRETEVEGNKRMPIGECERLIIELVLMSITRITRGTLSQFNEIMVAMGYRIYAVRPLRARYYVECLKRMRLIHHRAL